jgi:biotin transport system substrate-specific component
MSIAHPGQIEAPVSTQATTSAGPFPHIGTLNQTLGGKIVLAVSASFFVAVCARVSVPLPFTPVPLTFSDLAVLLVGLALGPGTAFAALALYLMEGAVGMPVFNPGGLGGVAQLFGHTGGYLMAYPASAALASVLFRRLAGVVPRLVAALTGAVAGSALLMVCGVVWLGFVGHLTPATAFKLGALPFIPGQIVKVCSAAGIIVSFGRKRRA